MRLLERVFEKVARPLRLVMLVAAMMLVIVLAGLLYDVYARIQTLRTAPKDNVQWTVLQTQTEFLKLQFALHAAETGEAGGLKDLKTRFDIFYSRVGLLQSAAIFSELRRETFFIDEMKRLVAFRDNLAKVIDQGDAAILARLPELSALIAAEEAGVRAFVLDAIGAFSRSSDEERAGLANVLLEVAVLALVLFGSLALSTLVLFGQTRQLKRREEMLQESRARLSATTRSALDAVVVSDADGVVIDWNDGATACFGYSRDQAIGASMSKLIIPERYREGHRKGMERYLATGEAHVIGKRIEINALHANGHEFPVELALNVSKALSRPIFIAYLRDISSRREAESSLKAALETAQAATRSKANFLAVMSHEMRTPLNGVIGTLDLLERTALSRDQDMLVKTALASGEALLAQINDVLDFSKMEAGKLAFDLSPFAPEQLIRSVVDVLKSQAASKRNQLAVEIEDSVPEWVLGDSARLRQVLLNFGSNAVKFTKGGEITFTVRSVDDAIEMSVRDTGIGIAEVSIPELFKEFSMVDASYQRTAEGTGLGLAICKRIIDAMGGEIGVETELGKGSRFWFRVKLPETRPLESISAQEQEEVSTLASGSLRLLLVEDNLTNQMVASRMLTASGHHVVTASDGAEAVAWAQNQEFDAILMDISMPVMDGLEATSVIRAMPEPISKTPIIAMTANAVGGDREHFLAAGMDAYLSKPIRQGSVNAVLQQLSSWGRIKPELERVEPSHHIAMAEGELIDEAAYTELSESVGDDLFPKVIRQFLKDLDRQVAQARTAGELRDKDALQRAVHALAGLAATTGAQAVNKLATDMELACKSSQNEAAFASIEALGAIAERTRNLYASRLAS